MVPPVSDGAKNASKVRLALTGVVASGTDADATVSDDHPKTVEEIALALHGENCPLQASV